MERDLLKYATAFKSTYLGGYEELIEPEHYDQLGHLELLLHGRFIGYHSTTYGAGYEWRPGEGAWEVRKGVETVNRLFSPFHYGLPSSRFGIDVTAQGVSVEHSTVKTGATVAVRDGGSAFFWRSRLEGNSVIHLSGSRAELLISECDVGSDLGRRFVHLAHLTGSNEADRWSAAMGAADAERALLRAQVEISLDRLKRRPYQHLAKSSVLLLGDFSAEGRERLRSIEMEVRRLGWEPVYVDDFEDIPQQDIRAKVLTLASICRFIVIDDSSKAGQLAEVPLVEQVRTPCAILRLQGSYSSSMTRGIGGIYSVLNTYTYNADSLPVVVARAAAETEEIVRQIEQERNHDYRAWRDTPSTIDRPKYGLTPKVRQSYE